MRLDVWEKKERTFFEISTPFCFHPGIQQAPMPFWPFLPLLADRRRRRRRREP